MQFQWKKCTVQNDAKIPSDLEVLKPWISIYSKIYTHYTLYQLLIYNMFFLDILWSCKTTLSIDSCLFAEILKTQPKSEVGCSQISKRPERRARKSSQELRVQSKRLKVMIALHQLQGCSYSFGSASCWCCHQDLFYQQPCTILHFYLHKCQR